MDSRRVLTLERGPVGTLYTVGVSGYRYVWHDDPDWRPLCTEGPAPAQRARPLAERQPVRDTDCTIYIEHASEVLVCAGCRRRKTVEAEALSARLGIAPDYERGLAEVSEEDHQLRERLRLDRAHGPARHVPVGRWR
jgi:hypothetical protein